MNKVRYLTEKKIYASFFLALKNFSCKGIFVCFVGIMAYSSCFALNYNEISEQKKVFTARNFFDLIQNNTPIMEPKLNLNTPDGKAIGLKEYRGKIVLLYFWASWCNKCMQELEYLQKLKEDIAYHEQGDIEIIVVSVDFKPWEKIVSSLAPSKIRDLVILLDNKKQLMGEMGVKSLPTSFLIDPNGYIILRNEDSIVWNSPEMLSGMLSLRAELYKNQAVSAKKENDTANQSGIITKNEEKKQPMIIN